MKRQRRFRTAAGLTACFVLAISVLAARAGTPATGTLTERESSFSWKGGPLVGGDPTGGDACTNLACDSTTLTSAIRPTFWRAHPGGIVIRISWVGPNDELDLYAYDDAGNEVGRSDQFHTDFEQLYLPAPKPGVYTVRVIALDAVNTSYTGTASIVRAPVAQAPVAASTMRFAPPALVDPQLFAPEPSVWTDRGDVMVAGISQSFSFAWRSADRGRNFSLLDTRIAGNAYDPRHRPCTTEVGGEDADIITDRTGRMYLADLDAGAAVATSSDHGETWSCVAAASSTTDVDRPWLAPAPFADGDGPNVDAYLSYRDGIVNSLRGGATAKPTQMHVDVTSDGGATWTAQSVYGRGVVDMGGPIFTAHDGTVYQVFDGLGAVWIARSRSEGRLFEVKKVSQRLAPPRNRWVGGAVDRGGNVYVAWVDSGTLDVMYSYSTDQGSRWSTPLKVNPVAPKRGSGIAVMPWVAAGASGDVAIAWYGADGRFPQPSGAGATTPWNAYVARTGPGPVRGARFEVAALSETPMHYGPICGTTGGNCDHLRDFFEIAIDDRGALVAAFNDNGFAYTPGSIETPVPEPFVVVARQTQGRGMTSASSRAASITAEVRGDALYPRRIGMSVPSMDLTGPATVARSGASLIVTMPVADGSLALPQGRTTGQWLTLFKANGRYEYAGVTIDATGTRTFVAGDRPVGVDRPERLDQAYASYPAALPATGRVDGGRGDGGRIVITIPMASLGLHRGDTLHSVQSFTLAGTPQTALGYEPFDQVDATGSHTFSIR